MTITIAEETGRFLKLADFGFSDADGNGIAGITLVSLPTEGRLYLS